MTERSDDTGPGPATPVVERLSELPRAVWAAARTPGERTAVALLMAHGYWLTHPGFVYTCAAGSGDRPAACARAVAGDGVSGPRGQPPFSAHAARHAGTIAERLWGRWSPAALARGVRAVVAVVVGVELARQAVTLSIRGVGRRRDPGVAVGDAGRVSLSEVEQAQQRYAREVRRRFTWQLARMEKRIIAQGTARAPDTLPLVLLAVVRRELVRRRQASRRRSGR